MEELKLIIESEFDYFVKNGLVEYDEEFVLTYNLQDIRDLFDKVDNVRLLDLHYYEIKEMMEDILKGILISNGLRSWYHHFNYYEDILIKYLNNNCDNIINMLK